MPEPSDADFQPVLEDFRRLLLRCLEIYRDCARDYARRHPELIQDSADAFVGRMVELHRGLVLKVFVEAALADHHLSAEKLELAREVFAHAWGRRLTADQTREALRHYLETTQLRWDSLLGPFERLSSFRERAAELQEVVLALARLAAGVNGPPDRRAEGQLKWIRSEMRRVLERVPLAGSLPPAPEAAAGRQAVREQPADFELRAAPGSAVRREPAPQAESLEEVLEELDGLIGLAAIKQEVRELVNFLRMQEERKKYDLPQTPISLHAVFTGNPGTGKTTVARLFGRILGAMGILARGHLVETDRSGLVAEYAGQTAPKTNQRITEALDGVLFIDEAYSLVAEGGDDPYGTEALQALLKRMEDERGRLVVILAGYPKPMRHLLRSNPGLSSRFARIYEFPDYTAAELGRIFETMSRRDRYRLPARTRGKLLLGFQYLLDRRGRDFGNGRVARNVFERSVRRLAGRLANVRPLTRELLTTLQPEDVFLEGVPEAAYAGLDGAAFRLTCPGCGQSSPVPLGLLGQQVKCRHCAREFEADWGEVVPAGERGAVSTPE